MSAKIIEFPTGPGRFASRIEVREQWVDETICTFVVEALDCNGRHFLAWFANPDEADDFAGGFRLAHQEQFARDIARRGGARTGHRAPAPWWIDDDHGGAA